MKELERYPRPVDRKYPPLEEEAMRKRVIATAFAVAGLALGGTALAQDAYVIGVTAAMTGPQAGILAPVVEMAKAYLDHVNSRGGINGKPVQLIVLDDQGEPSRAASWEGSHESGPGPRAPHHPRLPGHR